MILALEKQLKVDLARQTQQVKRVKSVLVNDTETAVIIGKFRVKKKKKVEERGFNFLYKCTMYILPCFTHIKTFPGGCGL